MRGLYPLRMTYTQWRRAPFAVRHQLIGLALNNQFRYWRTCADARCRRARACRDFQCYWRRLHEKPFEEQMHVRRAAEPLVKLLRIGSGKGSQGRPL